MFKQGDTSAFDRLITFALVGYFLVMGMIVAAIGTIGYFAVRGLTGH